jgi:hypothetical protein
MIRRWKRAALIAAFWGIATTASAQYGPTGPTPMAEPMPIAASAVASQALPGSQPPPAMPGGPAGLPCDPSLMPPSLPADDEPGPCTVWTAGAGAYFIKPRFSSNPAFLVTNTANPVFTNQQDFSYEFSVSPRAWLACTNPDGFGLRAQWWQFDQSAQGTSLLNTDSLGATISSPQTLGLGLTSPTPFPPNVATGAPPTLLAAGVGPDLLTFDSRLKMNVWDFEGTKSVLSGPWCCLLSAGARYAFISQSYSAARIGNTVTIPQAIVDQGNIEDFNVLVNHDSFESANSFNGAGPTVSLEIHWQVPKTQLGIYGTVRGTVLFGDRTTQSFSSKNVSGTGTDSTTSAVAFTFNNSSFNGSKVQREDTIPVGEFEAGMEWGGPKGLFLKAAVVGQEWGDIGNASGGDANLKLFGLSFGGGVNF